MQIDEIKCAFHPFCEDRSSTLRLIVNLMYSIIFTPTTLRDVIATMQRIQRGTSYDNQLKLSFPPAVGQSFFPKINGGLQ